jgi:hypothetical protein
VGDAVLFDTDGKPGPVGWRRRIWDPDELVEVEVEVEVEVG